MNAVEQRQLVDREIVQQPAAQQVALPAAEICERGVLEAGHVFTCEPGLYYPEQGFGVRLEDVIWIDPDGGAHNLTDYPKELVVDL